jgi:hypothetical protein
MKFVSKSVFSLGNKNENNTDEYFVIVKQEPMTEQELKDAENDAYIDIIVFSTLSLFIIGIIVNAFMKQ